MKVLLLFKISMSVMMTCMTAVMTQFVTIRLVRINVAANKDTEEMALNVQVGNGHSSVNFIFPTRGTCLAVVLVYFFNESLDVYIWN